MNTLPETIQNHARALPEGGVLSPKEFLHLGSRAAVDQAFRGWPRPASYCAWPVVPTWPRSPAGSAPARPRRRRS